MTRQTFLTLMVGVAAVAVACSPAAELDADMRPTGRAPDWPVVESDKPVRLIAEAEDFQIQRGQSADAPGWAVMPYGENYFASNFAISFLSRGACLSAPAQIEPGSQIVATQLIQVPVADSYRVLARYEQPYKFSAEFELEIVQNGRTIDTQPFGRLEQPKYWAFSKGVQAPMKWWFWGGGDNIVWQAGDRVDLAAGPATLRLIARAQVDGDAPRAMAAKRNVDVICLTNDQEGFAQQEKPKRNYLPFDGWMVQAGDLFVRVTNPADGLGPCVPIIAPYMSGQHSPWWVHERDWPTMKLTPEGYALTATAYQYAGPHAHRVNPSVLAPAIDASDEQFKSPPDEWYLQPGQTSGWAPMGQMIDALHLSKWLPGAQYQGKAGAGVDLELEFAIPDGRGGLTSIHKTRVKGSGGYPSSPISFEMPNSVLTHPERLLSHIEILTQLKERIAAFPDKGQAPQRLAIYGIMGFSGVLNQPGELGRLATEIAVALGDSTLTRGDGFAHTEALGLPERRTIQVLGHVPPTAAGVTKTLDNLEQKGQLDKLKLISYGDEHYIPPAKIDNEQFQQWLADRGIDLAGAGYDGPIELTGDVASPLYYYARLCAFEKGVEQWAEASRIVSERTGGHAVGGVNYGPAAQNMVDEVNFVRALKMRGVTTAWSEDYVWQMPEFSIQITGYRVSGFRAGAKYHDTPILMYIMPHTPGNTPRDTRLSYYSAIAHGTTMIHFYCATPAAVSNTENYIATHDLDMFRTVHDLTHETGVFEDYVLDGRVRPARVGMLLSSVDDIRNPTVLYKGGDTNVGRKAIYFALRHAQVPVDFLSEDDVIDGLADDYGVIYVTQEYLHSNAVTALQGWVERGGTLVALCGGGFVDELGRPNPDANRLYGVSEQSIEKDTALDVFHFKQDLPAYKPLDTMQWTIADTSVKDVPVILWKQRITADDGEVIGTYSDGSAAVVRKAHGKGKAVLFGSMAALAYVQSGLELKPWDRGMTDDAAAHYLPTTMDTDLRHALVDAFLPGDFTRPVVCSEPLVETTCIDAANPDRLAVPLINFTGTPIETLTVRIADIADVKRVRSIEQGELKPRYEDGVMIVQLPLGVTDMLLIDR